MVYKGIITTNPQNPVAFIRNNLIEMKVEEEIILENLCNW